MKMISSVHCSWELGGEGASLLLVRPRAIYVGMKLQMRLRRLKLWKDCVQIYETVQFLAQTVGI